MKVHLFRQGHTRFFGGEGAVCAKVAYLAVVGAGMDDAVTAVK